MIGIPLKRPPKKAFKTTLETALSSKERGVEKQVASCQELGFDPGPSREAASTG